MFPLAFLASCGMICDFMDSEKQLTGKTGETSRPADVYDFWAWFEVNKLKVAVIAAVAIVVGFSLGACVDSPNAETDPIHVSID